MVLQQYEIFETVDRLIIAAASLMLIGSVIGQQDTGAPQMHVAYCKWMTVTRTKTQALHAHVTTHLAHVNIRLFVGPTGKQVCSSYIYANQHV